MIIFVDTCIIKRNPQTSAFDTPAPNKEIWEIGYSPINKVTLQQMLRNYPKKDIAFELLQGFMFGFKLHYQGPRLSTDCKNLISARENPSEIWEKIQKEIKLGRIAGSFSEKPIFKVRVSPIGLIPKMDGSWRFIIHLSHPEFNSVNYFIDPRISSVQYTSFDKVMDMISEVGKGALLAKIYIKSAFRLLPIYPGDFDLLGFKLNGSYFFDKCLPMGCSISRAIFEKFLTFLE
ncbi:hypothetical protein SNE40_018232 [Patella caerulea]|uniref:Reverse transcriptase n=1 Tax=Patella caerulea TaxID=87958 RepID=A0AAN8J8D9_PATCE